MGHKKKLADASTRFSQQQINDAIAEGKKKRDEKNHRDRGPEQKVGRNDYCPCGSGLKNKHCHNATVVHADGKNFDVQKMGTIHRPSRLYKKLRSS